MRKKNINQVIGPFESPYPNESFFFKFNKNKLNINKFINI